MYSSCALNPVGIRNFVGAQNFGSMTFDTSFCRILEVYDLTAVTLMPSPRPELPATTYSLRPQNDCPQSLMLQAEVKKIPQTMLMPEYSLD